MTPVQIGENIRKRRELMNLRQEDLSELSHINVKTIQLIEAGRANPSISTLQKIAEVLGLELNLEIKKLS